MKILISNDDGWDAPGIAVLHEVASYFGQCTVVAPADEKSGISHQLTMTRPLELTQQSENVWSLDGTPADCVRVALTQTTQFGTSFDLVLSGVNNGGNLGADIYVSGTVAAAREATLFGLPAIAISQHRSRFADAFDWTRTKDICAKVLKHCIESGLKNRDLLNVNLPDVSYFESLPEVDIVDPCPLDPSPRPSTYAAQQNGNVTRLTFTGKYNNRIRTAGCDVETCFAKSVSITRLQ
jgi:5'-nucleotidase